MILASLQHCFHDERHVPRLYCEHEMSQQPPCMCLPVQLKDCKEQLDTVSINISVVKDTNEHKFPLKTPDCASMHLSCPFKTCNLQPCSVASGLCFRSRMAVNCQACSRSCADRTPLTSSQSLLVAMKSTGQAATALVLSLLATTGGACRVFM